MFHFCLLPVARICSVALTLWDAFVWKAIDVGTSGYPVLCEDVQLIVTFMLFLPVFAPIECLIWRIVFQPPSCSDRNFLWCGWAHRVRVMEIQTTRLSDSAAEKMHEHCAWPAQCRQETFIFSSAVVRKEMHLLAWNIVVSYASFKHVLGTSQQWYRELGKVR